MEGIFSVVIGQNFHMVPQLVLRRFSHLRKFFAYGSQYHSSKKENFLILVFSILLLWYPSLGTPLAQDVDEKLLDEKW